MLKKGIIVAILMVVALGIGIYSFFHLNNQIVKADHEKQNELKAEGANEQKSEARKKVEQMTDDELKNLLIKGKKGNKGEVEVTREETEMLRAVRVEEYYDLFGMTDDEVLGHINSQHQYLDEMILLLHRGEIEHTEKFHFWGRFGFEWIKENYNFENEYYNKSINEVLNLMEEYAQTKNRDALFSLKFILYELNQEFNPESIATNRANELTLFNAVRIWNGKDPLEYRVLK